MKMATLHGMLMDAHGCSASEGHFFCFLFLPRLLDSRGYLAIERHDCQSGLFGV